VPYDSESAFRHHDQFAPSKSRGNKQSVLAKPSKLSEPATPTVTSGPSAAVVEPPVAVDVPEAAAPLTVVDTPTTTPEPTPAVLVDSPASPTVPESQELSPAPADGSFPQPTPSGDTDSGN
jgi:hypothetical protein